MSDATIGSVNYKFSADLSGFNNALSSAENGLARLGNKARSASGGVQSSLDAMGKSARFTKNELTNLGAQLGDIASSGGLSFRTLLQQGPQVFDTLARSSLGVSGGLKEIARLSASAALSTKGLGVAAAGAATIGTAAFLKWTVQADALANSLNGIGRRTGLGALGLAAAADRGSALSQGRPFGDVTTGAGRDLAATYAKAGLPGDIIPSLIGNSRVFAGVIGADLEEAAARLAEAFADPAKGAVELNKNLGFLDAKTKNQIDNLAADGRIREAQKVLLTAFSNDLKDVTESVNAASKAFRDITQSVSNAFSGAGAKLASLVNPTDEQALARKREALKRAEAGPDSILGIPLAGKKDEIARLKKEIADIEEAIASSEKAAKDKAAKQETDRQSLIQKSLGDFQAQTALTVKAIEAVTLGEKLAVSAEQARTQALAEGKGELMAAAQAERERASAIAQASRAARENLQAAKDQLSLVGLKGFERDKAEIDIKYRDLRRQNTLGSQPAPGGTGSAATPTGAAGRSVTGIPLSTLRTTSGQGVTVASEYKDQFAGFIRDLEATGYRIKSIGGYNYRRNVNNPSKLSEHAFGNAIDINPASNPNGSSLITDLPSNIRAIAEKWGLKWGGDFKRIKDAMHFEVAKNAFKAEASSSGQGAAPKSSSTATTPGTVVGGKELDAAQAIETQAKYESRLNEIFEGSTSKIRDQAQAFDLLKASATGSAGGLAKLAEEQRLLNQLADQGIKLTPEIMGQVKERSGLLGGYTQQIDDLKQAQSAAANFAGTLTNGLIDIAFEGGRVQDVLKNIAKSLASNALNSLLNGLFQNIFTGGTLGGGGGGGGGLFGGILGGLFGGFKAEGGPVSPGVPYIVGEKRPEVFVPRVPGVIVPRVPNVAAAVASGRQGAGHAVSSGPPVFNVDARGAQAGVAEQITAALSNYHRNLYKQMPGVLAQANMRM